MITPHTIPLSANTHTRKQKILNYTEHDLKMTSDDIRMTSNDLKMTSNEPVRFKKKTKGCMSDDNANQVGVLFEQDFSAPING